MQGNADPKQDWQNRAARLQQLAEHQAVLICIHPQLFLVRLMFGLQGITNPKPRLLLSSLNEAKANWTADAPWLVITSELLQDSCGLDLIRWTKTQSSSVKAVLLLTENHSTSQAEALEAGADAIVMEESIEHRTGALIDALESILKDIHYIDPSYQNVTAEKRSQRTNGSGVLSPRQSQILALVAQGLGNREIAERLHIAPTTARDHVQAIMRRLNVNSRAAAAVMGVKLGLITTPNRNNNTTPEGLS